MKIPVSCKRIAAATAKLHNNAIISGTSPHGEKIFAIIFFILFYPFIFILRMIGEAFSEDLQNNQEAVPETPYIPL